MRVPSPRLASFVVAAVLSSGCASTYVPQSNGRIALMSNGLGGAEFVRNGVVYRAAPFGGDIDKAVAGNPRAEAEIAKYQTGQTTGSVLTLVGLAGVIAGVIMAAPSTESSSNERPTTGLAVMLGGLVVELVGVIIGLSSTSHLWDAINIYNDGIDAPPDDSSVCRPLPTGATP